MAKRFRLLEDFQFMHRRESHKKVFFPLCLAFLAASGTLQYLTKTKSEVLSLSLAIKSLWTHPIWMNGTSPITSGSLIFGFSLIVVGYHFSFKASQLIGKKLLPWMGYDQGRSAAFQNLAFYGLLVFSSLFSLNVANVPLTMFTVMGGALAIGVGFGSQTLLSNFISGIILQMERPVKVGDIIELDAIPHNPTRGVVEKIGTRSTVIRSVNNTHVVVPNSLFLDRRVINWTLTDNIIQSEVRIIVPPQTDVEYLIDKLENFLDKHPGILKKPCPNIIFADFYEMGAISILVHAWIRISDMYGKVELDGEIRRFAFAQFVKKEEISVPPRGEEILAEVRPIMN